MLVETWIGKCLVVVKDSFFFKKRNGLCHTGGLPLLACISHYLITFFFLHFCNDPNFIDHFFFLN